MSTPYLPPLDRLLALSLPGFGRYNPWPDYLALGFTAEHVPELMRMVLDEELEAGDGEAEATHGPIHAWRTLGLLRAESVRRYLNQKHGFPLHRINVISYGESAAIADNTSRDGRSQNRRVALVVLQ